MKGLALTLCIMLLPCGSVVFAQAKSMGGTQVNKPLNVYGQSRTLNMMMILKGKKEKVQGVNPRQDFSKEIRKTNF